MSLLLHSIDQSKHKPAPLKGMKERTLLHEGVSHARRRVDGGHPEIQRPPDSLLTDAFSEQPPSLDAHLKHAVPHELVFVMVFIPFNTSIRL